MPPKNYEDPIGDIPPNHRWVTSGKLAKSNQGAAIQWNLVDENENVVDPDYEIIRPGCPGEGHHREAYIQQLLVPSGTEVTDIYTVPAFSVYTEKENKNKNLWRIYMPYYPLGDLGDLVEENRIQRWPLPEPFVWYLFHRLANAAMVMDTKLHTGKDQYVVVHLDLKPDNILLGNPGSLGVNSDFVMYPPAYMGDFGVAEITYHGDEQACRMHHQGTLGYMPPEIWRWRVEGGGDEQGGPHLDVPAHSYTNIWQIGKIMLSVLEGTGSTRDVNQMKYNETEEEQPAPAYKNKFFQDIEEDGTWSGWSRDLIDLVHECVRYRAVDRPSPQDLLDRINELIPRHAEDMTRWGTSDWFDEQMKIADPDPEEAENDAEEDVEEDAEEDTQPEKRETRAAKKRRLEAREDNEESQPQNVPGHKRLTMKGLRMRLKKAQSIRSGKE